MSQLLTRPG